MVLRTRRKGCALASALCGLSLLVAVLVEGILAPLPPNPAQRLHPWVATAPLEEARRLKRATDGHGLNARVGGLDERLERDRDLAEVEDELRPHLVDEHGDIVAEEAVEALLPLDPSRGDWMIDDNFEGSWRLAYTSSLMFRSNEGLSGYGYYVEGVSTPELIMRIGSTKLTFEEPLDEESAGALATYLRLLEPPDAVRVHCSWQAGGDDSLKCTFEQIEVGSKAWKPANAAEQGEVDFGQDKAIRVMGNTKPVYLDDQVLVLRALTDAFFVLLKA